MDPIVYAIYVLALVGGAFMGFGGLLASIRAKVAGWSFVVIGFAFVLIAAILIFV